MDASMCPAPGARLLASCVRTGGMPEQDTDGRHLGCDRSVSAMSVDESHWQAIQQREDAAFRYGVRSTRIYCRPTCPSRRPNRDNVVLFDSAAEAEDRKSTRLNSSHANISYAVFCLK